MIGIKHIRNQGTFEICISFSEDLGLVALEHILKYLRFSDSVCYYIFFGYREYNRNIEPYYKYYRELTSDKGIIRLKETDISNTQLIYNILNEFQICSLYINESSDLTENFDFAKWRDSRQLYNGYVITDMMEDYIIINKDSCLPDWNISKMGIQAEI
ncbi:hypothetical protein [Dysgonomonas sp. ZJ279]|uniref:hypothetical protein n=1 Tax=Dysgonomonas sp. ZJ279 TaxID=2709796 RepID=UPI0013EC47A4|nr:hypothetical protein [Dysgonomonas sp. ZJ279]